MITGVDTIQRLSKREFVGAVWYQRPEIANIYYKMNPVLIIQNSR